MQNVARLFDIVDAPSTLVISPGGSSVLVNNMPIAVQGSSTAPHTHGNDVIIGVFNQEFSSTVTAENKPVLRRCDACDCGHKLIGGSPNVWCS